MTTAARTIRTHDDEREQDQDLAPRAVLAAPVRGPGSGSHGVRTASSEPLYSAMNVTVDVNGICVPNVSGQIM